jgi:uncharacterized membrane protein
MSLLTLSIMAYVLIALGVFRQHFLLAMEAVEVATEDCHNGKHKGQIWDDDLWRSRMTKCAYPDRHGYMPVHLVARAVFWPIPAALFTVRKACILINFLFWKALFPRGIQTARARRLAKEKAQLEREWAKLQEIETMKALCREHDLPIPKGL